jgi:hypothetical protein
MYRLLILLLLALPAHAHEMTPAYVKLEPSHVEGVVKAEMSMFNKRKDADWYEIGVFTEDWQPVPFVSSYKVMRLRYLEHIEFDVYIRSKDAVKTQYICSHSKLKANGTGTLVVTRICSKLHH